MGFLEQNSSPRLGIYFEKLWQFFLREAPGVRLLAANLPVREGGRTLGEFDLIYHCQQRDRFIHLELAVKFYLGHATGTDSAGNSCARQWLGPNSRDRLDIKLDHMLQRQIRLGEQPAAAARLATLQIDELHREIAFRGTLFQPAASPMPPPAAYNPERRMESWYRLDQWLAGQDEAAQQRYRPLDRLRWLAPASRRDPGPAPLQRAALAGLVREHFSRHQRPLLIARLDAQGNESGRFFITGNNWPNTG